MPFFALTPNIRRILTICVFLILQGCGTGGTQLNSFSTYRSDPWEAFIHGDVRLTCELACSGSWGSARSQAKRLYENSLWKDLVAEITRVGENGDLPYFYLARSAEGLGYPNAALTYYSLSSAAQYKCDGLFNNCDGIDVPKEASARAAALRQHIANEQKTIASNNPPAAATPAPLAHTRPSLPVSSAKTPSGGVTKGEKMPSQPASPKQSPHNWLQGTLKSVMRGKSISEYWCPQFSALQSHLFSPRTFQILDESEKRAGNMAMYTVRIESSNRGGMPIINNWLFILFYNNKDRENTWCISKIMDASKLP